MPSVGVAKPCSFQEDEVAFLQAWPEAKTSYTHLVKAMKARGAAGKPQAKKRKSKNGTPEERAAKRSCPED
jgi:hypothetical protein